jgi:hypothetical protein
MWSQSRGMATQFQDAINSGDIDSALGLLADDAVLQVDGIPSLTGKAEIESWFEMQSELGFDIEGVPAVSEFSVAYENCSMSSAKWGWVGVKSMTGTCQVANEGELITRLAFQFDDDAKARLSDSPAATIDDLIGIWTGGAPWPGGDPHVGEIALYHLQFAEDGSARLAVTPNDLSIAPNGDHPGAYLTWTYQDYVLTIQNEGSASEGYCLEQDVGTYLVKNVNSVPYNRMQFKLISDPCVWRAATMPRVAAPWDPYLP